MAQWNQICLTKKCIKSFSKIKNGFTVIHLIQGFPNCGTRESCRWYASYFSLLINLRRPFFVFDQRHEISCKMPNVQAETFFGPPEWWWPAGTLLGLDVARWNLAGSGCGPRDKKVAGPCGTPTPYRSLKWYACKKSGGITDLIILSFSLNLNWARVSHNWVSNGDWILLAARYVEQLNSISPFFERRTAVP